MSNREKILEDYFKLALTFIEESETDGRTLLDYLGMEGLEKIVKERELNLIRVPSQINFLQAKINAIIFVETKLKGKNPVKVHSELLKKGISPSLLDVAFGSHPHSVKSISDRIKESLREGMKEKNQ